MRSGKPAFLRLLPGHWLRAPKNTAGTRAPEDRFILIAFAVLNILIAALALHYVFRPLINDYTHSREILHMRERMNAVYKRYLLEYEDNKNLLVELEKAYEDNRLFLLPYERIAGALDEAGSLAAANKLRETAFHAAAPAAYEPDVFGGVFIIKAAAAYAGYYEDLCRFAKALAETDCRIDGIFLTANEENPAAAGIKVYFTLYGMDG